MPRESLLLLQPAHGIASFYLKASLTIILIADSVERFPGSEGDVSDDFHRINSGKDNRVSIPLGMLYFLRWFIPDFFLFFSSIAIIC